MVGYEYFLESRSVHCFRFGVLLSGFVVFILVFRFLVHPSLKMANQDNVDLFGAFISFADSYEVCEKLLNQADPAVALLALECLSRIENEVSRRQFLYHDIPKEILDLLRRWRNSNTSGYNSTTKIVLRRLTIFKTLEIPQFIDDYGKKNLLSGYEDTVYVDIDLDDPIHHVTHYEEAMSIADSNKLRATDNKNIIRGCWFGLPSRTSVYGNRAFGTTLSKLGVGGLRQGEIVSYKNEVNVILYADEEADTGGVKRPTDEAAKIYHMNDSMYVKVSIFVPRRFLPKRYVFDKVITGPFVIEHGPFCVREKRTKEPCFQLDVSRSYYLPIPLKQLAENIIQYNSTICKLFRCQLPMVFTVNLFTYGIAFDCPYSGSTINRKTLNYKSKYFSPRQQKFRPLNLLL